MAPLPASSTFAFISSGIWCTVMERILRTTIESSTTRTVGTPRSSFITPPWWSRASSSRRTEPAGAPSGVGEGGGRHEVRPLDLLDQELGDTIAGVDRKRLVTVIHEDDAHLA